jgi:hypothetical protein
MIFIKRLMLILACITMSPMHGFSLQSCINPLYTTLLGNEDASENYKESIRSALKDSGVTDIEQIAIKKMNGVASCLVGSELCSFTLFGIWINEPAWDTIDPLHREFMIYHEAAHYARNHHQTLLASLAPSALLTLLIPIVSPYLLSESNRTAKWATPITLELINLCVVYKLIAQPLIQRQEDEADRAALQTLHALGKDDVVNAYIKNLEHLANGSDYDVWWQKPLSVQVASLQDAHNS